MSKLTKKQIAAAAALATAAATATAEATANKLLLMLESAKVEEAKVEVVKYATSSSKNDDGTNKQKRNLNATVRSVAVVTSASLNTCWIGTHLGFATKTNAQALNIFVKAPQQTLKVMQKASDLVLVVVATNVLVGNTLEIAKLEAYEKYAALNYTMLCRKAKVDAVLEEAKVEEANEATA